jgi:hypothetical protein
MYYFNMRYSCSSTDVEPVTQPLLSALQYMFNDYICIIQYPSLNVIFKKYFCTLYTHKRDGMDCQDYKESALLYLFTYSKTGHLISAL